MKLYSNPNAGRYYGEVDKDEYERVSALRALKDLPAKAMLDHFKKHPEDLKPGAVFDSDLKDAHPFNGVLKFNKDQLVQYLQMGGEVPKTIQGNPTAFAVASRIKSLKSKDKEIEKWDVFVEAGMDIKAIASSTKKNIIYAYHVNLPDKIIDDVLNAGTVMDYRANNTNQFIQFVKDQLDLAQYKELTDRSKYLIRKVSKKVNLNPEVTSSDDSIACLIAGHTNIDNISNMKFFHEIGVDFNKPMLNGEFPSDHTSIFLMNQFHDVIGDVPSLSRIDMAKMISDGMSRNDKSIIMMNLQKDSDFSGLQINGKPFLEMEFIKKDPEIQSAINAKEANKAVNEIAAIFKKPKNQ